MNFENFWNLINGELNKKNRTTDGVHLDKIL